MHSLFRAALVAAAVSVPSALAAQATDTLPFRAGQWGAEFTVGGDVRSAGVLRFLTPRRAIVLDLLGATAKGTASGAAPEFDYSTVSLRIGHRWYRPVRERIVQFATLGAAFTHISSSNTSPSVPDYLVESNRNSTGGGVYADVGAAWMVAPQLSLGAAWTAAINYERQRLFAGQPTSNEATIRTWSADAGRGSLRLNLYF